MTSSSKNVVVAFYRRPRTDAKQLVQYICFHRFPKSTIEPSKKTSETSIRKQSPNLLTGVILIQERPALKSLIFSINNPSRKYYLPLARLAKVDQAIIKRETGKVYFSK
jgi:hypothetical protein